MQGAEQISRASYLPYEGPLPKDRAVGTIRDEAPLNFSTLSGVESTLMHGDLTLIAVSGLVDFLRGGWGLSGRLSFGDAKCFSEAQLS
jgi:hypothetical protein